MVQANPQRRVVLLVQAREDPASFSLAYGSVRHSKYRYMFSYSNDNFSKASSQATITYLSLHGFALLTLCTLLPRFAASFSLALAGTVATASILRSS